MRANESLPDASFIKHQKREYLVDVVKGVSIKE